MTNEIENVIFIVIPTFINATVQIIIYIFNNLPIIYLEKHNFTVVALHETQREIIPMKYMKLVMAAFVIQKDKWESWYRNYCLKVIPNFLKREFLRKPRSFF